MNIEKSKLLDKIQKLLALSTSPNPAEAASALAKVQQLMTEHNLAMGDVHANQVGSIKVKSTHDECVSHTQVYNYGYGSTVYQFVGPLASVKARQANVLYSYPPDPYMSSITKPTEIAPGLWHGTARHSNTSD